MRTLNTFFPRLWGTGSVRVTSTRLYDPPPPPELPPWLKRCNPYGLWLSGDQDLDRLECASLHLRNLLFDYRDTGVLDMAVIREAVAELRESERVFFSPEEGVRLPEWSRLKYVRRELRQVFHELNEELMVMDKARRFVNPELMTLMGGFPVTEWLQPDTTMEKTAVGKGWESVFCWGEGQDDEHAIPLEGEEDTRHQKEEELFERHYGVPAQRRLCRQGADGVTYDVLVYAAESEEEGYYECVLWFKEGKEEDEEEE